jgi:hypothetical protein
LIVRNLALLAGCVLVACYNDGFLGLFPGTARPRDDAPRF